MNQVMRARILAVLEDALLVYDSETEQEIIVRYGMACRFCPGEQVCICYNGMVTKSIPPQLTALCIRRAR